MNKLVNFIKENAVRGGCMCDQCRHTPENPEKHQSVSEHIADVVFFNVGLRNISVNKEELKERLMYILYKHEGEFNKVNVFDGKEHNFMELGGWVGDQGLALTLMGLGKLLGVWELLTPDNLMPFLDNEVRKKMAGMGMVSVKCFPEVITDIEKQIELCEGI